MREHTHDISEITDKNRTDLPKSMNRFRKRILDLELRIEKLEEEAEEEE